MTRMLHAAAWTGLLLACVGCRRPPPGPTTRPAEPDESAATRPAEKDLPEVPVDVDEEALVSKVLVKDTTVADRHKLEEYRQDATVAAGVVRGVCFVPAETDATVPTNLPIWPAGPNAVRDGEEGEQAYFEKHAPRRLIPVGRWDRSGKRRGIGQTVLIFRGIKSGRRRRLSRPSYVINYANGNIQVPKDGYNHGRGNICFAPLYERVLLANTDFFDCRIEIAHADSGQVLFDEAVGGYRDPKHPHKRYGEAFGMKPLKLVQTRALLKTGMWTIRCKKHPWHKAYLFVVDSPYVDVSRSDGSFEIEGVPAGTYDVDVWHPEFRPLKTRREVTVAADKTAELAVEFAPPACVTDPVVPTTHDMRHWVCAGPFVRRPEAAYPPQELHVAGKAIDYTTTYPVVHPVTGEKLGETSWQPINADAKGGVDVWRQLVRKPEESTWYFATEFDSPSSRPVVFGVGMTEGARMWLNGELIHTRSGPHNNPWGRKNEDYLVRRVKAGRNTILVRVDTYRREHSCWFSVTYDRDDVKDLRPGGAALAAGYVPDASKPSGAIKGVCFFPAAKPVHLPRSYQLDLSGKLALRDPAEGELEHYTGAHRPVRSVPLGAYDDKKKRYGVQRAVLRLKAVDSGRRLRLQPARFRVDGRIGDFAAVVGHHDPKYHHGDIVFHPAGKPLHLQAADVFGDEVVLRAAGGAVASSTSVPAYHDKYFPGRPYDPARPGMSAPQETFLGPLTEPGRYVLSGRRHPWLDGHVFVCRHPYGDVSDGNGAFALMDVPAGKHTLEVWHERYEPVKRTLEVEVAEGKTAVVNVEFKTPKDIAEGVPRTERDIIEWVCAGPFPLNHGKAYPPEEQVDFKAEYTGLRGERFGWGRINAAAGGVVDIRGAWARHVGDATWYLATVLQSPKARLATFGVGARQYCKLLLNGKVIYDRPDAQHRLGKDEDYVLGELKAGANLLLVKVSSSDGSPQAVVTYKAPGAKPSAPSEASLVKGYLFDDRVPTGSLHIYCHVPSEKEVPLPPGLPIRPRGIRDPQPGEQAFYERHVPTRGVLLGRYDGGKKRYPLALATAVLRGVSSGKRRPLTPPALACGVGADEPDVHHHPPGGRYGREHVAFAPAGRRLAIANGEIFPDVLTLTPAGGKPLEAIELPAYEDKRYPGKWYGAVHHMSAPGAVATPTLPAAGRYTIASRRHPWKTGYVIAADSPYVGSSDGGGWIRMDDVPAGRHTLDLWHPQADPLKAGINVEIKPGKATTVEAAFKPPGYLRRPPALPAQKVAQWVCVGPFPHDYNSEKAFGPEKALDEKDAKAPDFGATYAGRDGRTVRWKLYNADPGGLLHLGHQLGEKTSNTTWYAAALLQAPRDGKLLLGVGTSETGRVWLNGELLLDIRGRSGSWDANRMYVIADVKRGSNVLLARMNSNGTHCGVRVTYDDARVKAAAPPGRRLRTGYAWDGGVEAGKVVGACFVPFEKPVHVPRMVQRELTGAMAIPDPAEGEAEYYRGARRPGRELYLGRFDGNRKRYGVRGAVIRLLGVRRGRRLPLRENRFRVDPYAGRLEVWSRGHNYSAGRIGFCPVGEPVPVTGGDVWPGRLLLRKAPDGPVVSETVLPGYEDPKKPGVPWHPHHRGRPGPPTVELPGVGGAGHYLLADARHPWLRAHVWMMDHPYAAVSDANGHFALDDVPVGQHMAEVWHPELSPEKKVVELKVTADADKPVTLELPFKPPALLTDPPAYTTTPVVEWVYAGPFEYDHAGANPPEEAVDFAATHEGKDKAPVAWRRVNARADGQLELARATGNWVGKATWYVAALIESPKAGGVTLGVGSMETSRLFLNGRLIYDRPDGHGWVKDEDIVRGSLKPADNVLLLKLTSNNPDVRASVTFKAEGARATVPDDARLRPSYLWTDGAETGRLSGSCFVAFEKQVPLPTQQVVDAAVRTPTKGEAEHFADRPPVDAVLLGGYDAGKKRYGVREAAVVLRAVKAGPRHPLRATSLLVSYGSSDLETSYNLNGGRGGIAFAPAGAPLHLANGLIFPCPLTVADARTGKPVAQVDLPSYKDARRPGVCYGEVGGTPRPTSTTTPPLAGPARYRVTARRHPWMRADVIVTDNPYVALTDANGNFRLDDVPAGRYTLSVWHPDVAPVKADRPVRIAAGKDASVEIAFKVPAILKRSFAAPEAPVTSWAFLGVFDADAAPDPPPERQLDLRARFKARGGATARWRRAGTDKNGRLDAAAAAGKAFKSVGNSFSYACTDLHSDKPRDVLLAVRPDDAALLWVNGRCVYRGGSGVAAARLRRGRNVLLVRLHNGGGGSGLQVSCPAEGVKAVAPLK